MKPILRCGVAALALCVLVPVASAHNCKLLASKTMCVSFKYSTGGSNSYTAFFAADHSFTLTDVSGTTGTWTCAGGLGLLDVEYMFGGFEQQSWYATTGPSGNTVSGTGRSITNGYMYTFTSTPGACAADAAASGQPGARQSD